MALTKGTDTWALLTDIPGDFNYGFVATMDPVDHFQEQNTETQELHFKRAYAYMRGNDNYTFPADTEDEDLIFAQVLFADYFYTQSFIVNENIKEKTLNATSIRTSFESITYADTDFDYIPIHIRGYITAYKKPSNFLVEV